VRALQPNQLVRNDLVDHDAAAAMRAYERKRAMNQTIDPYLNPTKYQITEVKPKTSVNTKHRNMMAATQNLRTIKQ
jgi:hypothetical protein